MGGADRSALASIFATALNLADEVAPAAQPGIDGATAGAIGQSTRVLRQELEDRLNKVPSIVGIPPTVLDHLATLARIVRGTRTECVAYGDVALYLARSDMRTIAANGWRELTRTRPENQRLMAWADDVPSMLPGETGADVASTPDGASAADLPTGFLGGAELADALGVHAMRREAFFRQLERQRMSLGDDSWHEVREPRPNNPRFLYRVNSPKLLALVADYKNPKPA